MKTINVKELRLGNLLYFDGNIASIDGVQSDGTVRFCDMSGTYLSTRKGIYPIPISEEFLIKLKFIPIGGAIGPKEYRLKDSEFCIYTNDNGKVNNHKIFYFKYANNSVTPLDSMHHLQNLYFALTGQELSNGIGIRIN